MNKLTRRIRIWTNATCWTLCWRISCSCKCKQKWNMKTLNLFVFGYRRLVINLVISWNETVYIHVAHHKRMPSTIYKMFNASEVWFYLLGFMNYDYIDILPQQNTPTFAQHSSRENKQNDKIQKTLKYCVERRRSV